MKQIQLGQITLAISLLFAATSSQAQIHITETDGCGSYAAKAVYQFRSQQAAGCGYSGLRWNEDGAGQHNWCRTVRPIEAENETKARATEILKCINPSASYNPNDFGIGVDTLNSELSLAASRGATERMQQLIAAGADFTSLSMDLMSNAIDSKKYKTIAFLQRMGVPLSTSGNNPLLNFISSSYNNDNNIEMLKWLLKNGINPNDIGGNGYTPLREAIQYDNEEVVALLLKKGANPNLDIQGGNCTTIMPLDLAVDSGNEEIIKKLRRAGAKTQAQCGG